MYPNRGQEERFPKSSVAPLLAWNRLLAEVRTLAEQLNDFDSIADVYDQLVSWAPYDRWVRDLAARLGWYGFARGQLILDCACGTGLSTFPWAEHGCRVVGTDCSEKMLQQASSKLRGRKVRVTFIRQDMLELELPFRFDAAICMHSGLDYILELHDLARAFRSLRGQLRRGGLLAFDKCLDEPGFYRKSYTDSRTIPAGKAVFEYSWDRKRKLFDQRCTVLRETPDGSPGRTEVLYRMKPVPLDELVGMVEAAGFETLEPPRQFSVSDPGMGIFRAV